MQLWQPAFHFPPFSPHNIKHVLRLQVHVQLVCHKLACVTFQKATRFLQQPVAREGIRLQFTNFATVHS